MNRLVRAYIDFIKRAKRENSSVDLDKICQKSAALAQECLAIAMDKNQKSCTRGLFGLVPQLVNSLKDNWKKNENISALEACIQECQDDMSLKIPKSAAKKICLLVCPKVVSDSDENQSASKEAPSFSSSDSISDSERTETDEEGEKYKIKKQKVLKPLRTVMSIQQDNLDDREQTTSLDVLAYSASEIAAQSIPLELNCDNFTLERMPSLNREHISIFAVWRACNDYYPKHIALDKFLLHLQMHPIKTDDF